MDRKSQQNLVDARTYFNNDLTKDVNSRYKVNRIDLKDFNLGMKDGYNVNITAIPENMKDNYSYKKGFEHAKRDLKIQSDLYEMGKNYFLTGNDINNIPVNYRNNEYFYARIQ